VVDSGGSAETALLWNCIREMPGSNVDRASVIHTEILHGLPQAIQANFAIVLPFMALPLSSILITVHYDCTMLFDAMLFLLANEGFIQ
jgi:hypothetical protein